MARVTTVGQEVKRGSADSQVRGLRVKIWRQQIELTVDKHGARQNGSDTPPWRAVCV